jgi:hypothetical protein
MPDPAIGRTIDGTAPRGDCAMTDDTTKPGATSGDEGHWQEPEDTRAQGREWVGQLQQMIEQLANQAAPVIREVGVKAAELAALAGEKAGPVAHRAAALTSEAGLKLAERSRDFAAEIRRDQAARGERPMGEPTVGETAESQAPETETGEPSSEEPTTTGVG